MNYIGAECLDLDTVLCFTIIILHGKANAMHSKGSSDKVGSVLLGTFGS